MNNDQWPKNIDYKGLQRPCNEIRLLQRKTGPDAHLHYTLRHEELGESPPAYSAVSYCWGALPPESALKKIFIDGNEVYIRSTLRSFLKTLEYLNPEVSIWIDAICINQDDVKERNDQISIMGKIYREAQEVYVWLGKGDDDTNYAIDHIEDFSLQTSQSDRETFSVYFDKVIRSPYWTRRWVIQEFVLAKNLTIVRGSRQIKWRNLVKGVEKVLGKNPSNEHSSPSIQGILEKFDRLQDLTFRGRSQGLNFSGKMTLLELTEEFQAAYTCTKIWIHMEIACLEKQPHSTC